MMTVGINVMITLTNLLYMISYLLISVTGVTLLKLSDGKLLSFNGITGLFLYALGFLIWYMILTRISLSVAFPIAAGGLVVVTQVAGYYFLKEQIGISHIIGIVLIIIGITVVASNKGAL